MTTPEETAHWQHLARLEREHASAQLVEMAQLVITEIKNEWLYQTGQFSRVASPPTLYPPQGSMHGPLRDAMFQLADALAAYRRTEQP